jgi:hypothetical protein
MNWFFLKLGRLDASLGDLLINDGKETFTMDPGQSGLQLHGQVRDIKALAERMKNLSCFQNDERPVLLKLTKPTEPGDESKQLDFAARHHDDFDVFVVPAGRASGGELFELMENTGLICK